MTPKERVKAKYPSAFVERTAPGEFRANVNGERWITAKTPALAWLHASDVFCGALDSRGLATG